MANRFHRDLRLLMCIGGATAGLILAAGVLGLRGALWGESRETLKELVIYAAAGAGVLAITGLWAWGVVRKIRRERGDRGGS